MAEKDPTTMPVRLRIGHKLTLALAALLLTTVAVAAVGISSLGDVNRRARALYTDNVRTTEATSALWSRLYEAEETACRLLSLPAGSAATTKHPGAAGRHRNRGSRGQGLGWFPGPQSGDAGRYRRRVVPTHALDPGEQPDQVQRLAAVGHI